MKIHKWRKANVFIVQPEGRIDAVSFSDFSTFLKKIIEDEDARNLILDFSKTTYMSSAGVRVLIEISRMIASKKGSVATCSLSGDLKELFELVHLNQLISIHKNEDAALEAILGSVPHSVFKGIKHPKKI